MCRPYRWHTSPSLKHLAWLTGTPTDSCAGACICRSTGARSPIVEPWFSRLQERHACLQRADPAALSKARQSPAAAPSSGQRGLARSSRCWRYAWYSSSFGNRAGRVACSLKPQQSPHDDGTADLIWQAVRPITSPPIRCRASAPVGSWLWEWGCGGLVLSAIACGAFPLHLRMGLPCPRLCQTRCRRAAPSDSAALARLHGEVS